MSQANDFEFGDLFGEKSITKYTGSDEVVRIPEDVAVLGDDVFAENQTVAEIYVPDSVTTIDRRAFYNCTNLKKLVLPKTLLRSFGQSFANGCTSLEEITLPGGQAANGFDELFVGCTSLKRIYIPADCNAISLRAFSKLDVELVVDPDNSKYVFENGCLLDKQTGTVIYMREEHTIPAEANAVVLSLNTIKTKTVELPDNITSIKAVGMLSADSDLCEIKAEGTVVYVDSAVLFGSKMFTPEKTVTYLTAPKTSIAAFPEAEAKRAAAKGFAKYIVEGGTADDETAAEYLAFIKRNKSKLMEDSFVVEYLVKQGVIKASAVNDESITLKKDWEWKVDSEGTVTITEYKGTEIVVTVPSTICGKKVTAIGDCAFAAYDANDFLVNSTSMKDGIRPFHITPTTMKSMTTFVKFRQAIVQINLPDGLETIGSHAFRNCLSLKQVSLPASVKTIGRFAFCGCRSLESVVFPDDCELGTGVLALCTSLKTVSLPSDITTIPDCMFDGCEALEEFVIPESVETICAQAFAFCKGLKSITIGSSVRVIGDCVFAGSGHIEQFHLIENSRYFVRENCLFDAQGELIAAGAYATIPEGTTAIGQGAFVGSLLEEIVLPDSVKRISSNAFSYCENLKCFVINKTLADIPQSACCYCPQLESLVIPGNIKSIGRLAFQHCGIQDLTLEEGVEAIRDFAFVNNPIKQVVLPESLMELDENSFLVQKYYARAKTPPKGWRCEGGREALLDPKGKFVWGYTDQ